MQTQQRPSPGLSCYDDVGSSYLLNMKWWHQVFGAGIPGVSTYSSAYIYGAQHVALALDTNPDFVFMSDQVAGAVSGSSLGLSLPGEFGGTNMSVLGYADGRAAYVQIVPGAVSGPGYTFGLPGLLTATPVPTTDELP